MDSGIGRRRAAAKEDSGPAYSARRLEIITAAAQVFKDRGLQRSTLGDVAVVLGTDRASLYYYFPNKEELFHEVVREAAEANVASAEAIRDGAGTGPEKVRMLIESLVNSYATHYPYLYVYIQENMSHLADLKTPWARQMQKVNRRYDEAVLSIVQQGIDDGTLTSKVSARLISYGLIGMVNWSHRWFNPAEMDAQSVGASLADMMLAGLQPRGRARS